MEQEFAPPYPATRTLCRRLAAMLREDRVPDRRVEILERRAETRSSTFPCELVRCRTSDGFEVSMLCKYSARGRLPAWHRAHGHRGGVEYETNVYRHLLGPLQLSTPRLLGASGSESQTKWIAIEYLDDALRISSHPEALVNAAEWIGRFHACNETRVGDGALQFLTAYTEGYYRGWADRTAAFARRHLSDCSEVDEVCAAFEPAIASLLEAPTIIHGEFYPSNVLWRRSMVHPVDWETAAIGAGEIDLVCLTEHWPDVTTAASQAAYIRARWPGGHDHAAFRRRLAAAGMYMLLRWAGTPDAWSDQESRDYHVGRLHDEARRFNDAKAATPPRLAANGAC